MPEDKAADAGLRPIAALRARKYALQTQHEEPAHCGLRRRRSGELAPAPAPAPVAVGAGGHRVAPRIAVAGRQQSEPGGAFSQPPARRIRTMPSSGDLEAGPPARLPPRPAAAAVTPSAQHHHAFRASVTPKASTVRGTRAGSLSARAGPAVGGSLGRAAHAAGQPASAPRPGARRPLPSPGGPGGARASYIPQPAAPSDVPERSGPLLVDRYQEKSRDLAVERETNNQLLKEIHAMAAVTQSLGVDLGKARAEASDARQHAARVERALAEQQAENAALAKQVAALSTLVRVQSAAGASGEDSGDLGGNWRDRRARMVAAIGAVRASCNATDDAAHRDLHILDDYLRGAENTKTKTKTDEPHSATAAAAPPPSSPRLFTPRQRRLAAQDERVGRRRSTMLFAGLIRRSSAEHACARCEQLQESLQAVAADNGYYREANDKLRDSIADMVSSHNAMVRVFERERRRRRENRAHELAEASHLAARDRALLEAQQRADLGMAVVVDPAAALAQRFGQALRITSPTWG
ncbi:hypothetical protein H4R18_004669 [Coemansia javaensis]|uniref:Uncharacterized protein n=1 Tax=Coemansia javaensis TaxID=2761396 RepID=A0A9W8LFF6_9FUNG|nr:hypothetical protein H4R18_004669 [Coemansia javaensis]